MRIAGPVEPPADNMSANSMSRTETSQFTASESTTTISGNVVDLATTMMTVNVVGVQRSRYTHEEASAPSENHTPESGTDEQGESSESLTIMRKHQD